MTHIDNSQGMSSEQVKEALTNLINKSAQKVASEGKYDKTILAKIQYCSDAVLGQYKIQYQNGYYTAYSLDKTIKYNDGAMVYVTVPGNDLSNRLFIQDSATNDSSQRTYLTNLEGDQQYAVSGPNFIKKIIKPSDLNMSSHWDMPEGREITYYKYSNTYNSDNKLSLIGIGEMTHAIRQSDGFIRFGAEFKTSLLDNRKLQGNYGIRLVLVFDKEDPVTKKKTEYTQTYQLDTFLMDGTPFDFGDYAPRYQYWKIDKDNFKRIQSISGFVMGFEEDDIEPIDIFVRNISVHAALKMYDSVANDDYVVKVLTPQGTLFGLDNTLTSLPFEAHFTVRGNEVGDNQNIKYYWAKKNVAIDSVGNLKYLKHFGKGWQCLNQSTITKTTTDDPQIEELKDYVIDMEEYPTTYKGILNWISAQNINIPKNLCLGRETIIKCCVIYENKAYYSDEYMITNINGYYVLLDSSNGTEFFNGKGYTTLTAGVFQTEVQNSGEAATYKSKPTKNSVNNTNISYKWEIVNNGVSLTLPAKASADIYVSEPDWKTKDDDLPGKDDVTATNSEVNTYLQALSVQTGISLIFLSCCLERFSYYNDFINNFDGTPDSRLSTAKARVAEIKSNWGLYLDQQYNSSFVNNLGLYVLGPSDVTAKYNYYTAKDLKKLYDSGMDPLSQPDAVSIDTITHNYNPGSTRYHKNQQNTLFNVQIAKIVQQATFKVTALITQGNMETALETKEININNTEGSGVKYNLEITNGTQTFIYNAGGRAPDITIRPLSYRVYDESGELLFDSAGENSEAVVTRTKPKWSFYTNSTLINTKYSSDLTTQYTIDSSIPGKAILRNAAQFHYGIAKDFNINFKERSNIELSITYEGEVYNASTNFTFAKQGDLGTNGTNLFLEIEDPYYEQYRSDILTNLMYSKMTNTASAKVMYSPNERHLKNLYMYATKTYTSADGAVTEVPSFDDGDFCNLRFAKSVSVDNEKLPTDPMYFKLNGATSTTLYGYWYENGSHTLVDASSKWYASGGENKDIQDQTRLGRSRIYDRASFQFDRTQGSSIMATLVPPTGIAEEEAVFYKPFDVIHTENQVDYKWTANNVIQCTAKREAAEQIDPDTQKPIVRKNYGYYQIPFFYYAYYENKNGVFVNKTPEGLDPARHFVITGGYDEVIYGADGFDPQYNGLEPFTLHLFDINGKDISSTVFNGQNAYVTWDAAYGFTQKPVVSNAPSYASYCTVDMRDKDLFNKYCRYEGKTYKCIVSHTPNQYIAIRDESTGFVIKEYNKNGPTDFVTPYWEEVTPGDLHGQTRTLTPPPSYEACAVNTLFNSWISVKLRYQTNEFRIEAAALLPINVLCNIYGSDEINLWDGKKTVVDDGYIISSKVAAGIKNDDNAFTGITIGRKMITNGTSDEDEVGLFGYGKYYDNSQGRQGYGQTLFLDAKTGLAAFGPRGSTQIILNPKIPSQTSRDESWSRLAGWYFSPNYLYKPLWADDNYISNTNDRGNSSYYNTNPPDADGVNIPGSVGLYVPSSEKSGELTPDTVFMWASAAGISSLSFDDDGSLTALQKNVQDIKANMNKSGFPLSYPITTAPTEINPDILLHSVFKKYSTLQEIYGDDTTVKGYLDNYESAWNDILTYVQTDPSHEGKERYDQTVSCITDINYIFSLPNFPMVTRDGSAVRPIVTDGVTIENIDEIRKWYIDSNEPSVTLRTDVIENLVSAINGYNSTYTGLLKFIFENNEKVQYPDFYNGLFSKTGNLKHIVEQVKTSINELGIRTKTVSVWDTANPRLGVYNIDKVTIDNILELEEYYVRPAVSASEEQKTMLTNLYTRMQSYTTLHSKYEAWVVQYKDSAQAISYLDSNTKKKGASFYVTYGGKLHCNEAEIEGQIRATSGYIGPNNNNALQIATYHYDQLVGKNQFYLLYNPCFRVKGNDEGTGTTPSIYIDGTIMARSGQIGNAAETVEGDDDHTVFIEYMWYPRKLPDDYSRWGDDNPSGVNYRKPVWDETQGKIVKYSLWHPYFSIIDTPGGAVNYAADGTTVDFSYKAGDTAFIGRMYATGGRLGDWISDSKNNTFRDPYETIVLKPVLNPQYLKSGYINCSKTTIYGDGSIDGACQGGQGDQPHRPPSNPVWWITADGEAHFTNMNSEYRGKIIRLGGATIQEAQWDLPAGAKVNWGNATLSVGDSGFSFSEGASFAKNVNFVQGASFGQEISINNGATFLGSTLHFGGGSNTVIGPGTATLPTTTFKGNVDMDSSNITGANNITASGTVRAAEIIIGNQTLENYILSKVADYINGKSVTITGYTEYANEHRHLVSLSGQLR